MARFRVEDLLDCPRVCPKDIPVVSIALLPAALLEVLVKDSLVKVGLPLKSLI